MKILFIYPKVAETFWSFKHALRVVRRKSAFPPLGALTVAAMLPQEWEKRLVDLNVRDLTDADLRWADYAFISAMIAQKESTRDVIDRCMHLGVKTVCGGPLFNSYREDYPDVDHLVLGEGETSVGQLAKDLSHGCAQRVYEPGPHPPLTDVPIPLWDLINMNDYVTMSVQYSRGCPFDCEFCDIIVMNGRVPRTKSDGQMLLELDALYSRGWRGSVFIVDDNFIGNKKRVKSLLRNIILWQEKRPRRLTFFTEASVDLAEDEELMNLMVAAGFNKVFLGIETPSEESLRECGKSQNLRRSLSESVRIIQSHGLAVMGGFIIGFDNDPPDIFQRQVNFIQNNGIVTAMIGLLTAIPGTRLYKRLENEGRLLFKPSGNNTDIKGSLNFIPKMDRQTIVKGYEWVMNSIYSPEMYYTRILEFLRHYRPANQACLESNDFFTFLRSLWYLGIADQTGSSKYYWRLIKESLSRYRKSFTETVTVAIYGYHFRNLFYKKWIPLDWEAWLNWGERNSTGLILGQGQRLQSGSEC
ncbi:MAG: B12-binding domain-containing radical SAM protein [Deltaproteobacteria bacterium]|nr:B12-binding domain-containing radical SAM protein [Deltaproteobacteria bacterium]